jgi:hypothetical protein
LILTHGANYQDVQEKADSTSGRYGDEYKNVLYEFKYVFHLIEFGMNRVTSLKMKQFAVGYH